MQATATVNAGICGFTTTIQADSADGQTVTFQVTSDCGKIRGFAARLAGRGPVDAYQAISPDSENVILDAARESLKGCCAACVVPCAVFKAMQVSAGLALPRDIGIELKSTP